MLSKFKAFFLDHVNWCHPVKSDGTEKEPTLWFQIWCWLFWPIPWMKDDEGKDDPCWCCASVRGVIYGIVVGWALGRIFNGLF